MRTDVAILLRHKRGFTLIEVLLAVALFAVGMLALAGMFAGQMVGHAMGRNMTEATTLGQDLMEQLYNNPAAIATLTDGPAPAAFGGGDYCPGNVGCAAGVFIDVNKNGSYNVGEPAYPQYSRQIALLPGVPAAGLTTITVTVQWLDDLGATHSVVVTGVI